MSSPPTFATLASHWQNFYLLTGTAAASLMALMFVAATFGSRIIRKDASGSARAFLDPTFTHFVHVFLNACLVEAPTMGPTTFGVLLLSMSAVRSVALFRVGRQMRAAHRVHHDVEMSDWLMGIVFPLLSFLLQASCGLAFLGGHSEAFNGLAIATLAILINGAFGA